MELPNWIKPAAWGVVAGIVGLGIVQFSAGWVVMAGTAAQRADARAEQAVVQALTPMCVARFKDMPTKDEQTQLAALEETGSWQRDSFVADHGWATLPGMEEPDMELAEACAETLIDSLSA